jgi:uncharacterized protein involved in outer membrane biogenesis
MTQLLAMETKAQRYRVTRERSTHGGVLVRLVVFLVVVFAVLALAWMLFLPQVFTSQLRKRSGFDATIERLAVNPVTGSVEMRGFVLTNPPTFPAADFIELREFRANAKVSSLFSDQPVFDRMLVDAASVTLVKRQDGRTNAEAFQGNLEDQNRATLVAKSNSQRGVLVRDLEIRIDRLVIIDHSLRVPSRREFTLNLHQSYTDVTRIDQLLAPGALSQLAPVAIAVGGLLPGDWGELFKDAGGSGAGLLQEVGRKAGERVKGFFDALEESKKP